MNHLKLHCVSIEISTLEYNCALKSIVVVSLTNLQCPFFVLMSPSYAIDDVL